MGLGEKVSDTLKTVFEPLVDMMLWPVEKGIEWGIEHLLDTLGKESSAALQPTIDRLKATGEVPPEIQAMLDDIEHPTGQISALFGYSMARAGLGMVSTSLIGTLLAPLNAAMNALIMPSFLDTRSIIEAERRGAATKEFVNQEWLWSGYNPVRRDILKAVTLPLLDPGTLMTAVHRAPMWAPTAEAELKQYGFTDTQLHIIKSTWPTLPGLQDMVTFARMMAFSPKSREIYPWAYQAPGDFTNAIAQLGVDPKWAELYWFTHWTQPGPRQQFEMLHRGVISREDIRNTLWILGYSDFWIPKFLEVSYRVLTRVDVRRMHAIGVLDRDGVYKAYSNLGYNPANAELMTQFTERYNASDDRELTKTDVLTLYRKGTLSPDDTLATLVDLGYTEQDAYYLMEKESTAVKSEFRSLALTQVKRLTEAGIIDQTEATGRLASLGYSAEDIEHIYALWAIEFEPNVRQPSRTDLGRFYEAGIIDDNTWIDEMVKLGYPEEYIAWYYLLMTES